MNEAKYAAEISLKQESMESQQCRSTSPRPSKTAGSNLQPEHSMLKSAERAVEDGFPEDELEINEKVPSVDGEQIPPPPETELYPHGFTLITLTMALMVSTFMVALDTNVIGAHTHQLAKRNLANLFSAMMTRRCC